MGDNEPGKLLHGHASTAEHELRQALGVLEMRDAQAVVVDRAELFREPVVVRAALDSKLAEAQAVEGFQEVAVQNALQELFERRCGSHCH